MMKAYADSVKYGLIAVSEKEWNNLVERGIINPDTVLSQITMMKEEAVLAVHRYKISTLSDGRVGTYVPDDTKPRKCRNIKESSYNKMIDRLYAFYNLGQDTNNIRLCDIFDEWLVYKSKKKQNSEQTKKQNKASYEKYVKGTKIDTIPIKRIMTIDLEDWAINVLSMKGMTAKGFNTHKITVTGPLKYAKRKGYISENPWQKDEMEYTHLFKSERIKPSAEMVFYPDEIDDLCQEFERGYALNGNIANIGLMANFELGLRVGELSALRWPDINFVNETVFIQRMEDSSGNVVDYVKSDSEAGYRELDLSDELIQIFKRIKRESRVLSEYVFVNADGSRANKMQFIHRLTKAEIALGWEKFKYSHCIRRTVASRMNAEGWVLDEIRRWLGHTSKETTLKYLYNPYRESETKCRVKKTSILHTNNSCLKLSQENTASIGYKKMPEAL
ncbi:tyrosine-type recombinase/integrase [Enterocloster citroniae]|uniref:Tyr recombinase domain-containing protein n=1 Tax=[Clostridium] citroniae WAL-17108 TaxID=742733 RepID=G5HQG0_9FIRM|nr:tyrosine-type recombinase/integrase [Enterocloster citroniae]EHE96286.1 hypothetical protein HMPREF9469_04822 [ [[Clostridium] citroniae WAL-17108]